MHHLFIEVTLQHITSCYKQR